MIYVKRGVVLFAIFLLAASVVFAAHSSSVTTDYVSVYETTSSNVSITVNNALFSLNSIEEVAFSLNAFNILSLVDIGWESSFNGSIASFSTDTDKIGRWGSQTFGFEISAGNVDDNETVEWIITTKDNNDESQDEIIEILILNDDSAPIISDVFPTDGSFVQEGTADEEFSLIAVDEETGINSVSGVYGLCGNLSTMISFTNENDSYYSIEDLSGYSDSNEICYEYKARSNGGEEATAEGRLTIDGMAPEVELVFPESGALMNNNSLFQFIPTDTLAPTLDCVLSVDGVEADSVTVLDGDTGEISVENIPEGQHEWNVTCTDLAGNIGTSETREFTLDKTPPVINILSPENGAVNKAGVPIEVEVTDENGVTELWYGFLNNTYNNITSPFTVNTDNAVDGENNLNVYAADAAGNEAVLNYVMIVDREGPSIDVTMPAQNGTFDLHVPFLITVNDNYDPLLNCSVLEDGNELGSFSAENGNMTDETIFIDVGERAIIIQCSDDAQNSGSTDPIMIKVVDMSGPDISIEDLETVVRGETVSFITTITDYSGVDNVEAQLILANGSVVDIALTNSGDVYAGEYLTNAESPLGTYSFSVTANDTGGRESTAMDDFEVIPGYIITLDVESPVYEGANVQVSGTAQRDDGLSVPGDEINLALPEENVTLPLINKSFSTEFSAPSSSGTYNIVAYIVVDNRTFNQTAQLQVQHKNNGGGNGGGGGGSKGKDKHTSPVMHWPEEDNDSGELDLECNKDSDCAADEECMDNKCVYVEEEDEKLEPDRADPGVNPNSAVNMSNQPGNGVGRAGGFLNLENIKWSSLLWIIIGVLAVALLMKMFAGRGGKRKRGRKDSFDIDKYLASRRR